MRTAPPVCSPLTCTICLKFLDDFVMARAYLFCRLPILPLVCFSAPIPPTPFPSGEGGDYKFFCRGLRPRRPGIRPFTAPTVPAAVVPRRGACPLGRLPTLPLACFLAPIPPPPFPSGEGGDYKLILPGAPPPAPRHQTVYGTDSPCRCSTPEGGLPSWSPAYPAFSLLSRPHPPAPLPLRGRGRL